MTDDDKRDKIIRRRVRKIAEEHGVTVADVEHVLDEHPINSEPGTYLKRVLALELIELDELEQVFLEKAITERDPVSGALCAKLKERRGILLGLHPPQGHAVAIISTPGGVRDGEKSTAAFLRAFAHVGKPLPPPADADDDGANGAAH